MKELFIRNKIIIFRTAGAIMLIVGFVVYFWTTPKEVLSENEIAAANVARMEASVAGRSVSPSKPVKSSSTKILQELKNSQKKQLRYFTILTMIFGIGFLGYSFIKPKSKETTSGSEK